MVDVIKIEGYEEFKDLVRVENEGIAVSVREFHRLLGIKKAFTDWFKYQQERMSLVEGVDFITLLGESTGGRPSVDYITSLDNGKHLCMISQSDTAHRIRQYFVDFEREWSNPDKAMSTEHREVVLAKALQIADEVMREQTDKLKAKDVVLEAIDAKLEAQKPKVEYSMKRLV